MVLDLCTMVVSLITGIQISATRGAGNSLFDAQLHAWKIPPTQFRPLKALVEKLVKTVAASSPHVGSSEGDAEAREGVAELSQLLSTFNTP